MGKSIITGIDIGTTSIKVVVCRLKKGSPLPEIIALVKKDSYGLRRGYVVNSEEVSESLREALDEAKRQSGENIRRAFVSIGGISLESRLSDSSISVAKADLEIGQTDVNRALELAEANLPDIANRHVIHRIPIYYKLDGKKILGRPTGMKGNKLEARVMFITCLKQHVDDLLQIIGEAGISVEDVVASPIAASLVTLTKLQKTAGCILANIGSHTTSIAVFEDNIPISIQVFPIGSMDITNDIALGFRISLEEAERIKRGEAEPSNSRRKLDEIINARLSDIFEFIENHLKKIGRSGLLPAGILITGGGANLNHIEEQAKNYFRLPSKITTITAMVNDKPKLISADWSVAYGLCLLGSDSDSDETTGGRIIKTAKSSLIRWIKEFWP
jgi:cell division protein FtsA